MIFSVIDVETTGLSPRNGDRVVEIGVVRLDADGTITDVFDTLVNPERRVEATGIHGISDAMVKGAPTFRDILPRLCSLIDGTVLTAHNASFDLGFLREEFRRSGTVFPALTPVCTLILARKHLPGLTSRSLGACRRYLEIPDGGAHSALADARAAAVLLLHIIRNHNPELTARPFRSAAAAVSGGLFDFEPKLKPRKVKEITQ
jgi:DNA polymerase III epsilon subunit family exonuclease